MKISKLGTDKIALPDSQKRLVSLINQISVFAFFSNLFYISLYAILDFHTYKPVIITILLYTPFYILSNLLNKRYHYFSARFVLQMTISLSIFTCCFLFLGKEPGVHYYFLIFATMPIFIWSLRNFFFTYLFFLINIIFYLYIDYTPIASPFQLEVSHAITIKIITIILIVITVISIINLNQMQIEKNETILEEQKNQLLQSNATKDRLMSIIAHDLRSPFNSILGTSKILIEYSKDFDKEKIIKISENIFLASSKAYEVLDNLLNWAMLQKGGLKINPIKLNLHDEATEVNLQLMDLSRKKEILLYNTISRNEEVFADRNMLRTILRNLISNAIKFTPEHGRITVSSDSKETEVFVCVVDTGIGMTKEKCESLFSAENNTSTDGLSGEKGTGLGMILCKEFVEMHGGELTVESIKGEGSRFCFNLPKYINLEKDPKES